MRTASPVISASAGARATDAGPAPASAASAVTALLLRADGPGYRVADFSATQLFRLTCGDSTRLLALTRNGASYSANSVRLDDATFDAVRSAPSVHVTGARSIQLDDRRIQIVRTWRSEVVRRTDAPQPRQLRDLLPASPPMPQSLDAVIGLGQGLTPAGDDLVCGFLAAARAYDDPQLPEWTDVVRRSLHRTSEMSAEFLRLAAEGHVCLELSELLLALNTGQLPRAVRRIRTVGHSSGTDLAHGVLHYLTRAADPAINESPPTASPNRKES